MKDAFQELYENLKLDRQMSEWSNDNTLQDRFEELKSEIKEIHEALELEDYPNLRSEMGDALWDLMFMIIIAEEEELFTGKEVITSAIQKLKRRKPWIFKGIKIPKEEESRLWQEAKNKGL